MARRSPLDVVALEAREVPAAGAFADIMPGIWGSYPHDFSAAGQTLFFAADNGHGDELYVSDGTAAGTKMVRDIKPGLGGSDPRKVGTTDGGVA